MPCSAVNYASFCKITTWANRFKRLATPTLACFFSLWVSYRCLPVELEYQSAPLSLFLCSALFDFVALNNKIPIEHIDKKPRQFQAKAPRYFLLIKFHLRSRKRVSSTTEWSRRRNSMLPVALALGLGTNPARAPGCAP